MKILPESKKQSKTKEGRQGIENKRGEVEFRRRLFRQQVEGISHFDDEYDAAGIEDVLLDRMADTARDLSALRERGVVLSPYLEIGAERGQRSLVMENDLGCVGSALDLSADLLRSCAHYAERFDRPKLPLRVCGDAYRLPFASGSLPFVFCYQTLHHFPEPGPLVDEIHRVLAPGGTFFLSEEPYRKLLHLKLYRAKGGVYEAGRRGTFRKIIHRIFAEEWTNEEELGVIENHDNLVREWKGALAAFENIEIELSSLRVRATMGRRSHALKVGAALLFGGTLTAICRKADPAGTGDLAGLSSVAGAGGAKRDIRDALISPIRLGVGMEVPLQERDDAFTTGDGADVFPVRDDIAFLMDPKTLRELYPEVAAGSGTS